MNNTFSNLTVFILTVRLGDTFKFVLLLDGVRVGGTLGGVDELLSEAFSDGLDVSEGGLTGTDGQKGNGLVDSSHWRDIDGLSSDGTGRTNSGGVFSWTSVDNGVNDNLDWVLVGQEVDDLKGVLDNSDSLELLTVVTAVHHHGVGQTLNDWALGLSETLDSITTSSVVEVDWLSDLNVVGQRDVLNLNVVVAPFVEKLDLSLVGDNLLGELGKGLNLWLFLDFGHCVVTLSLVRCWWFLSFYPKTLQHPLREWSHIPAYFPAHSQVTVFAPKFFHHLKNLKTLIL